jgi:hypothetical protein
MFETVPSGGYDLIQCSKEKEGKGIKGLKDEGTKEIIRC